MMGAQYGRDPEGQRLQLFLLGNGSDEKSTTELTKIQPSSQSTTELTKVQSSSQKFNRAHKSTKALASGLVPTNNLGSFRGTVQAILIIRKIAYF
jgi:hypothetical protein